ncbi:MAG: VRR-NUC domain-containing protein [Candidatus Woesearchaeota archaeon]
MIIKYRYIRINSDGNKNKKHIAVKNVNKGLSEFYAKKILIKEGYVVWRPEYLNMDFKEHYPVVKNKYDKLFLLLEKHHSGKIEELKYLNHVHHGMPDFIVFKNNKFKFIESKLENEQLSFKQKKCISKLLKMGFEVEVFRIISSNKRQKIIHEDLDTKKKIVKEKQTKLKNKYI